MKIINVHGHLVTKEVDRNDKMTIETKIEDLVLVLFH